MSGLEILRKDLLHTAKDLAVGAITSTQLTKLCLSQIKSHQDLGAMLWINEEIALHQAEASDLRRQNGKTLGVLDGIPITLKDMILMKGILCTAASKILEGFMPPYEATVVQRLKDQGAVLIGKTNQDEFAMGSSNENSAYIKCVRNPWDKKRTPGGSSGGSAVAVSAGMCLGSLGTDTGGSIRQPASYCGVVGVKPTYGRVSRFGIIAFASSLDQVGPFAKTVRDAAVLLSAIAGYDSNDSTSSNVQVPDYLSLINGDIKDKKVGIPKEYFSQGLSSEVKEAVTTCIDVLEKNGAELIEISLPHTQYAVATYYIISTAEASSNLCRYDGIRYGPRRSDNQDLLSLYEHTRGELFGTEVKRRIMLGTYVLSAGYYDAYYLRAQKVRRLFAQDFAQAFQNVDVIVSPTAPTTAFKIGEKIDDPLAMYLNDIYTISANLAGICAISIPIGSDHLGLPIGMQLMASAFSEQILFDVASVVEAEVNFDVCPPILK
jgi:aspartyl-tRNA(Asn)/glutamyl-tRNA(Gln) amidotransferase subunit A